jgi:hypothetical protein
LLATAKAAIADKGRDAMDGRSPRADPILKATSEAVLRAFVVARNEGRPSVECYRAAVAAWRIAHPEQSPEYAAKRAVAVILAARGNLRADAQGRS